MCHRIKLLCAIREDDLITALLDLIAPKATASLDIGGASLYPSVLNHLKEKILLKAENEACAIFRVKGNFFADLESTKVVKGEKADPNHYENSGFNLKVSVQNSRVLLQAEERVIFGHIEIDAVGQALFKQLVKIGDDCT